METESVSFKNLPITSSGNTLTISLDKLNDEIGEYKIKVDSLTDIYIDKEASAMNSGDVLKIHTVYQNPDDEFDEQLFFSGYKEMEDKFESLPEVYSAEFDPADLILTLVLNKHHVKLHETFADGGAVVNPTTVQVVESQLKQNAKEVFDLVGIDIPANDQEFLDKLPIVKQKAIEHYNKINPQPVYVFFGGVKMDIAPGAGHNVIRLQQELAKRFYEIFRSKTTDLVMASSHANNKAILAIDMLRGMAQQNALPVFVITEDLIEDVITRSQEGSI